MSNDTLSNVKTQNYDIYISGGHLKLNLGYQTLNLHAKS